MRLDLGQTWVFTSNHCPCWSKRMAVWGWFGLPGLIRLVFCWLFCECLDSSVAGVMCFVWILSWLKPLSILDFYFFFSLQHFLPCFLEYIEHCFSDTDTLAKDEAMAILAKLILVKAEPPTTGSMAFEKYPLIFTESSVRWGFSSLVNTGYVLVAAGLRAVPSYLKVTPQGCVNGNVSGRFAIKWYGRIPVFFPR